MLKEYYRLTKPGIVYGNALPAIAGFIYASGRHVYPLLLLAMIVGLSLIIASACVFNNYLDRSIDKRMQRTSNRALVTGLISTRQALVFGSFLGLAGSLLLYWYVSGLTLLIALIGMILYVMVYGIAKRRTVWSTVIGSLSGAIPPVVGYVAATHQIDGYALLLFLAMAFWQIPHFYAISVYRKKDYAAAKLPVLGVVAGRIRIVTETVIYIIFFTIAALSLSERGVGGMIYFCVLLVANTYWLVRALKGFKTNNFTAWARKIFLTSLFIMALWCVLLSLQSGLTALFAS